MVECESAQALYFKNKNRYNMYSIDVAMGVVSDNLSHMRDENGMPMSLHFSIIGNMATDEDDASCGYLYGVLLHQRNDDFAWSIGTIRLANFPDEVVAALEVLTSSKDLDEVIDHIHKSNNRMAYVTLRNRLQFERQQDLIHNHPRRAKRKERHLKKLTGEE